MRELVGEAREYAAGRQSDAGWDAMRRVLAWDIPPPEWRLGEGGESERVARGELVSAVARGLSAVSAGAYSMRSEWARKGRKEYERRTGVSEMSEVLRVMIRAWRELADGVRAGAAQWDGRWKMGKGYLLARRLSEGRAIRVRGEDGRMMTDRDGEPVEFEIDMVMEAGSQYAGEGGTWMRWVLAWMRLVRAGKYSRRRWEGWRREEEERGRRRGDG